MMWLKNAIRSWLGLMRLGPETKNTLRAAIEGEGPQTPDGPPTCRISIMPAVNGKILVLSVYKPNPHGPDWQHTNHLIMDGDNVADAVATLLVRQAMTK